MFRKVFATYNPKRFNTSGIARQTRRLGRITVGFPKVKLDPSGLLQR
jgi:hypothetical protein